MARKRSWTRLYWWKDLIWWSFNRMGNQRLKRKDILFIDMIFHLKCKFMVSSDFIESTSWKGNAKRRKETKQQFEIEVCDRHWYDDYLYNVQFTFRLFHTAIPHENILLFDLRIIFSPLISQLSMTFPSFFFSILFSLADTDRRFLLIVNKFIAFSFRLFRIPKRTKVIGKYGL